jgi:Predicted transcriptional regulator
MDSLHSLSPLPVDDDALIPAAYLSQYVPVARQTLARWRYEGQGPRFLKIGRMVAYRTGDVREWLQKRTFAHTAAIPSR